MQTHTRHNKQHENHQRLYIVLAQTHNTKTWNKLAHSSKNDRVYLGNQTNYTNVTTQLSEKHFPKTPFPLDAQIFIRCKFIIGICSGYIMRF